MTITQERERLRDQPFAGLSVTNFSTDTFNLLASFDAIRAEEGHVRSFDRVDHLARGAVQPGRLTLCHANRAMCLLS